MHSDTFEGQKIIADLLIVTTSQRSDLDLVRLGEDVEKEKDRLLEKVTTHPLSISGQV